jgi:predicted acylesterase/phospholipase RssA
MPKTKSRPSRRIALALAGGGPLGAIYEVGALCALQDSLHGLALTELDHYVGVSAGGFLSAALANGITAQDLCDAFIGDGNAVGDRFDPAWLTIPAYGEYFRRCAMLPALTARSAWQFMVRRKPWLQELEALGPSLPAGIFSNEHVHSQLASLFSRAGRSNDFRKLRSRLTLVATDLDSGEAVPFGQAGWDHVPISRAVQASAALPGLFPPVTIDGHDYVDGALKKTLHASVVLEQGVDLLICLNPLVPFDASMPSSPDDAAARRTRASTRIPRIAEGGLPAVLSQTFRSLIHSRLELGMRQYESLYPDTDIVLIEPDHRDPELYLANMFSYGQRRHLAEHAYQQTRRLLRDPGSHLAQTLDKHGITLNHTTLRDDARQLCSPDHAGLVRWPHALNRLHDALDHLESQLPALATHSAW